jgi:hypothetical protein
VAAMDKQDDFVVPDRLLQHVARVVQSKAPASPKMFGKSGVAAASLATPASGVGVGVVLSEVGCPSVAYRDGADGGLAVFLVDGELR